MIPWYWSWILTLWGVTGLYFAGKKQKVGWMIGLSAQVLWITYAIVTHQIGFIFSAIAYGSVYLRNWMRWRNEQKPDPGVHLFCEECEASFYDREIVDSYHGGTTMEYADTQLKWHMKDVHGAKDVFA